MNSNPIAVIIRTEYISKVTGLEFTAHLRYQPISMLLKQKKKMVYTDSHKRLNTVDITQRLGIFSWLFVCLPYPWRIGAVVPSWFPSFLPQSKFMHVRWIGNPKCHMCIFECKWLFVSLWWPNLSTGAHLSQPVGCDRWAPTGDHLVTLVSSRQVWP